MLQFVAYSNTLHIYQ